MYKNFYPTPSVLVYHLVDGLKLSRKSILDPEAGNGAILDAIKDSVRGSDNLYAIEINPEFRAILADKKYNVIGSDFLTFPGLQYFDFIIMNPPFDAGAEHLLKAWEISNGATIRCLLNSETILHPHTKDRQRLAHLIAEYGWVKPLGKAFADAERKTQVDVTLVHLKDTRKTEPFLADFEADTTSENFDFQDIQDNALAMNNIFDNYEARFLATIAAFKELLKAQLKVGHFLNPIVGSYTSPSDIISKSIANKSSPKESYETFLALVTREAWNHLFSKTKLGTVTTQGVRKEIEAMQNAQGQMAFTSENMENLFHTLFASRDHVMLQCVLEVFDNLTQHYKENRERIEGWKTNSGYKVGKRFILPGVGSNWGRGIDYPEAQKLGDLEKALCFISGKRYEDISHIEDMYKNTSHFGVWRTSEFFETKLFKKGTMHFRWLDEDLRGEFNRVVARERWGELPEKTKSGAYK